MSIITNSRAGLLSGQERMESIADNISNIDTNGYKSVDNNFEDILHTKLDSTGMPHNSKDDHVQESAGSRADNTLRNFSTGNITETGRNLDLAINGDGFFRLKNSDGSYCYTRDGAFGINADGRIVQSSSGLVLDLQNNSGISGNDKIQINEYGQVFVNDKSIGKIQLYSFKNRDDMISKGGNVFTSAENPTEVNTHIVQNHIEKSNVDLTTSITEMIENQRIFSFNSRSLKTGDEMWQIANNLRNR